MNNFFNDGQIMENGEGIGTVTRDMVTQRAVELAISDGRTPSEVSESDWEQAKRQLTGKSDVDSNEALLESAPESERWDPLPGSEGHQAPEIPSEDEDDDGRSNSARLVEEGVAEAEHDQSLQAAEEEDTDD